MLGLLQRAQASPLHLQLQGRQAEALAGPLPGHQGSAGWRAAKLLAQAAAAWRQVHSVPMPACACASGALAASAVGPGCQTGQPRSRRMQAARPG